MSTGEMFCGLSPSCLNIPTEIAERAAPVSINTGRDLPKSFTKISAVPSTVSEQVCKFPEPKCESLDFENFGLDPLQDWVHFESGCNFTFDLGCNLDFNSGCQLNCDLFR